MSIFEIFGRLTGRELAKNKTKSTVRRAVIGPRWEKKKIQSREFRRSVSLLSIVYGYNISLKFATVCQKVMKNKKMIGLEYERGVSFVLVPFINKYLQYQL